MAKAYSVSDDDVALPIKDKSYSVNDDDVSLDEPSSISTQSKLTPESLGLPDVDYKGQLESLGAYAAAIPKRIGEMGNNFATYTDKLINRPLKAAGSSFKLSIPEDPFNYPKGSFLENLEKNNPTSTELGNLTADVGSLFALNPTTLGEMIGTSAAQNALTNPENPVKALATGAGSGLFGGLVGKAVGSTGNYLDKALKNPINEAAQRLGVTIPLGEATQNPLLKDFSQNRLTGIPFSGAAKGYANTGSNITDLLNQHLKTLRGDVAPEDIPTNIRNALIDSHQTAVEQKNDLYSEIDRRATQSGAQPEIAPYKNALDSIIKEQSQLLFKNPELAIPSKYIKQLQSFRTALGGNFKEPSDIVDYMNALTDEGFEKPKDVIEYLNNNYDTTLKNTKDLMSYANQLRPRSFKNASLTAGALNKLAYEVSQTDANTASKIYKARDGLLTGMEQGAEASSDPGVMDAFNGAQSFYKNQYAPYEDPEIQKYLDKKSDPDLITQSFVKTGEYARPTLLNRIMSKLNPTEQNQVAYNYLAKKVGSNGSKLESAISAYNKLNPQMRSVLFPDEINKDLDAISKVHGEIPDLLLNPPTGARLNNLGTLAAIASPATYLLGSGHPGLAAASVAGILGGGKAANYLLNSPGFRKAVSSMRGNRTAQALSAALNPTANIFTGVK